MRSLLLWQFGRSGVFSCLLLFCFTPLSVAQFDRGQIGGTILDPSQTQVPNARVSAINLATSAPRSAITGTNGGYVLVDLAPGTYRVEVAASGFRTFIQENVKVDAASRTTLDAQLTIGSQADSVTVSDVVSPLQDQTAEIGRVVDSKQITELALNGRNPLNLALTKAGVVGSNFNAFNPVDLGSNFSINGGPLYGNNVTVDGVNVVRTRGDGQSGPALIGVFNADSLQEVQILTSSYPAEYGRATNGQIRFVTKSGTRSFHGTAWEFFRNSTLDANTWTRNSSKTSDAKNAAPLRFNQPGYSFGGPAFFPKLFNTDRNKLFFFISEEWISYHQTASSTGIVPSAAMRRGDFSELLSAANPFFRRSIAVKDPLTGVAFPNNVIPSSRLSPNGIGLLNAFPLPTPGFQQGSSNWYDSQPNPNDSRKDVVRVDYLLGVNRFSFSGTIFTYKQLDPFRTGFDVANTKWNRPNKTGAFSIASTLSPRLINEFTATGAYDYVSQYLYDTNGVPRYQRSLYGIDFPYAIPGPKRVENRIPTIDISGFSTLDGSSKPGFSSGPMFSASDNVTFVANSAHTFKFGFFWELARQVNADQIAFNQNGWFTFRDSGNPQTSGLAIANTALGNFDTYFEIGPAADTTVSSNAYEAFAQDTWKVSRRITMEYGLRYSYYQPWHAKWNDIANFDPRYYDRSQQAVIDPRSGGIIAGDPYNGIVLPGNGYPSSAAGRALGASVPNVQRLFHNLPDGFVNDYYGNFSPRLGLAWRVTDHTVVRTGGGLFKAREFLNNGSLFRNPPNQARVDASNGLVDRPGGISLTLPATIGALANEYRYPTAYNYSFSVQHEFPHGYVLDLAYVGNSETNLLRIHNINQTPLNAVYANPAVNVNALRPYPGLAAINYAEQSGRSHYNSLQVSLDHRFRSGFGLGVAYTFSKNLDNVQTPYNGFHFVRAVSTFDRTHVLTFNYIYELPFFRNGSGLTRNLIGNWQISGVTFLRSGDPLSVVDSTDNAGVGSGSASQPWDVAGSTSVSGGAGVGKLWFNPAAFTLPVRGTFGNAGYNILRGPIFQNWDAALFKNVRIREWLSSQIRLEVFNFLNHPNLANPVVNPRSGSFGFITSKSNQRNVQLGLKFIF